MNCLPSPGLSYHQEQPMYLNAGQDGLLDMSAMANVLMPAAQTSLMPRSFHSQQGSNLPLPSPIYHKPNTASKFSCRTWLLHKHQTTRGLCTIQDRAMWTRVTSMFLFVRRASIREATMTATTLVRLPPTMSIYGRSR